MAQVEHTYKGYLLEITSVGVDVWNPTTGIYEAMKVSMEEAVTTVDKLIPEPDSLVQLRERIRLAVSLGYNEGDVSRNVQSVISQLQRTVQRTTQHGGNAIAVDIKDMQHWIRKLTLACDAEQAWLNTPGEDSNS